MPWAEGVLGNLVTIYEITCVEIGRMRLVVRTQFLLGISTSRIYVSDDSNSIC